MAELSMTDCDALKRCIEMARTYPNRSEQIDWKIEYDGWQANAPPSRSLPTSAIVS